MDAERMNSYLSELAGTPAQVLAVSFDQRRAILRKAAEDLDSTASDDFEVAATRFSEACSDTIAFARDSMRHTDLDRKTRFLIFTMGAIACRRQTDRLNARELFGGVGSSFEDIPLFKHLEALSYDGGSLRALQRGLELERKAYERIRPQAGSAHALASFIVQIAEQAESSAPGDRQLLEEGLALVDEAIDERNYPKFHYTRGRILRQLERWEEARDALLKAIELENRASVDAPDRLRDYRLELTLVELDREMHAMHDKASSATAEAAKSAADVARHVESVEEKVDDAVVRLEGAQVQVVAAIGFVASAIGLVQVTLNGLANRPFIEELALVAMFAVVLFGATFVGVSFLKRR
jgi:tetratricopeptide (TPR) repeat protein